MPIFKSNWNNLGGFNPLSSSSFMANATRNFNIATDTSIYKDYAKQNFQMYQARKKEEFDAQTGDIIARIMNGQEPKAINGNFDHKAVALAIREKKKVDYQQARDLIKDKQWEQQFNDNKKYREALISLKKQNLQEQQRRDTLNYNLGIGRLNEQQRRDTLNYNLGVGRLKEQRRKDTLNYNLGVSRLQEQQRRDTRNYNLGVSRLQEQIKRDNQNYNLGLARLEESRKLRESQEISQIYSGKKTPADVYDYSSGYITKDVVTHRAGSFTEEGKKTLDMIHLKEKERNRFINLSKEEQKKEARKYWQRVIDNPKSTKEQVDYAKKVLGEKNLFDKTIDVIKNAIVGFNEASDDFKSDIYGFFTKNSTKEANKKQIKAFYERTRKELGLSKTPTGNAVNEYMREVIEKPLDDLTKKAEKQKYYENVIEQMRVPATKVEMATQALKNAIDSHADSATIKKLKGFLYASKLEAEQKAFEYAKLIKKEKMKKENLQYRFELNKRLFDYKYDKKHKEEED